MMGNLVGIIEKDAQRTAGLNQQIQSLLAQAKRLPTHPLGLVCFQAPIEPEWKPVVQLVIDTLGRTMVQAFIAPRFRLAAWGLPIEPGELQTILVRDYEGSLPENACSAFEAPPGDLVDHVDSALVRALEESGPFAPGSVVACSGSSRQAILCIVARAADMRLLFKYDLSWVRKKLGEIILLVFSDTLDNSLAGLGRTIVVNDNTGPMSPIVEAILAAIGQTSLFQDITELTLQFHAWRMAVGQLCNMSLEETAAQPGGRS
jgi:hypothetical protein